MLPPVSIRHGPTAWLRMHSTDKALLSCPSANFQDPLAEMFKGSERLSHGQLVAVDVRDSESGREDRRQLGAAISIPVRE